MKNTFSIAIIVVAFGLVSCWRTPTAPPMNRMGSDVLWDRQFTMTTVIPAVTKKSQTMATALPKCVDDLDAMVGEFRDFMRQVETGKIKTRENPKGGLWQSVLKEDSCYFLALYPGETAPVDQFEKRQNPAPYTRIWSFWFHGSGRLKVVRTLNWGSRFDNAGRLQDFWFSTAEGTHELEVEQDGTVKVQFRRHQR